MTKTLLPRKRSPGISGDQPIVPRCSQDVVSAGDNRRLAGIVELENSAPPALASGDNGSLQIIVAAVSQLHANHKLLESHIREVHLFVNPLVPGDIVVPFFASLHDLFLSYGVEGKPEVLDAPKLAKAILERTIMGFVPTADLAVSDFILESCGRNMSVQCLGLICTVAARIVVKGMSSDGLEPTGFVNAMDESSSACLLLARDIAPRKDDILAWLGFVNLMFVRSVKSDADPIVSRRLGDHITDLYTLGWHRDNILRADVPFFLAELRRKTFVKSAFIDKVVATFADIPPRMMQRYADTRMPLDLSDTQVLAEGDELQHIRSYLTADGWNTLPNFQSAAWARMRYMLCGWREKILECSYYPRPMSEQHKHELR
nr:uncharacterized protein LOC112019604 [Quercus suber]